MKSEYNTSDEYNSVQYLEDIAVKAIKKRFNLTQNQGLDILAKSLLFEDYDHLYQECRIESPDYDVLTGCFFSEFILAEQLGLESEEAKNLKAEIDNYHFYGAGVSHGNIEFANLNVVNEYSLKVSSGCESRIMFGYPIQFYCRNYDRSFLLECGDEYSVNALWCDDFSFIHPNYFMSSQNMIMYVESILQSLLSYNNLIISNSFVEFWRRYNSNLFQFVTDNFENHPTWFTDGDDIKPYGLLFPLGGESLRNRINTKLENIINAPKADPSKIKLIDIGSVFKEARERKGLTKLRLAELSGISVRTIFNVENENHSHYSHTIAQLASVLDLDISNWLSSTR